MLSPQKKSSKNNTEQVYLCPLGTRTDSLLNMHILRQIYQFLDLAEVL